MSSVAVPLSHLAWDYEVKRFSLPVHNTEKVSTEWTMLSNDLAVMKVKSWLT
jgi:hypothetical protein